MRLRGSVSLYFFFLSRNQKPKTIKIITNIIKTFRYCFNNTYIFFFGFFSCYQLQWDRFLKDYKHLVNLRYFYYFFFEFIISFFVFMICFLCL
jgi:hypothetical protein